MPRAKGRQLPHVSVALTDEHFAAIDELAKSNGATVSRVGWRAVIEFLDYCCGQHSLAELY